MKKLVFAVLSLVAFLAFFSLLPSQYYPEPVRLTLYEWFGAQSFVQLPAPVETIVPDLVDDPCPPDHRGWRPAQVIDGVKVGESKVCKPDNPYAVAAAVKGTNNVSHMTLMSAKFTPDAVVKGKDLDGDGDPDEIHIRLEVIELNGASPDRKEPVAAYDIAPGVQPGFWVFAPKTFGMSTENFESIYANDMLRAPSPAIRVEQGDKVKITLENTHYFPHTIHFHGVDHPFVDENGEGNDGVPQVSELPIMPGKQRTYEFQPRQTGSMMYHCHVQPHTHILMGLLGMFVVEENRPNNWVQSINIGAGHVRSPSVAIKEDYAEEYDLQYQAIDKELHDIVGTFNDPRLIAKAMNRGYDITDASSDYYMLNGRSFPYTIPESLIVVEPDQKYKLRVTNASDHLVSLHMHGHKVKLTHYDGVEHNPIAQIQRDVVTVSAAQRVDMELNTTNDGLNNYGEGIWVMHDHDEKGVTTDGMNPGGGVTAIVYESFLHDSGLPKKQGVDWQKFFTPEFFQREIPVWVDFDVDKLFAEVEPTKAPIGKYIFMGILLGLALVFLLAIFRRDY